MTDTYTPNTEAATRLTELILDHLAIPRPGRGRHIQELQDTLLPSFMETARYTWMAASPMPLPNDPAYQYLQTALSQTRPQQIRALNGILEALGVHDLLRDVAESPDVAMLDTMPADPYEERLLRAVGHPNPHDGIRELLHHAATEPAVLAAPSSKLEEAATVIVKVQGDISIVINQQIQPSGGLNAAAGITAEKPRRRKLFSGLGKVFSGLVMLTGNGLLIPTVPIGTITALPVLASLAGGIVAVGEGVGQLCREGE